MAGPYTRPYPMYSHASLGGGYELADHFLTLFLVSARSLLLRLADRS